MPIKYDFNQMNITLISVENILIFYLKWVIYISNIIFCLIKTCAVISNSLFYSVELLTFSWHQHLMLVKHGFNKW